MELSSSSTSSDSLRSKREASPVHMQEETRAVHTDKEMKVGEFAMVGEERLPDDMVESIASADVGTPEQKSMMWLALSQLSRGFRAAMDSNNHAVWQRLSGKESKPSTLTWKQETLVSIWFDQFMQAFSAAKGNVEIIKATHNKFLVTAKQGHPRAAAMCGHSLYLSCGWPALKCDIELGKKLLIQARDAGDVAGKFWCALYGLPTGRLDRETAFSIVDEFHRSHPNHNDGYVLWLLGYCYYSDVGTGQDRNKAFELFQQSAALGNPLAMQYIGVCYVTGNGPKRDWKQSFQWWQKAAECGDARAMWYVGRCFKSGEGVLRDATRAVEWFEKAATLGYSYALKEFKKINETI